MVEEKILTINLRKMLVKEPKWQRSKKFVNFLINKLKKQTKSQKIKTEKRLNEKIWKRGIRNPPLKIRIKLTKLDDGTIKVGLAE